jgi:hypothetical protein
LLHRGASGVRTALDSFGKQFGFGVPPKKFLKIVVSRAGFVAADPFKLEVDHLSAGLPMQRIPRDDPGLTSVLAVAGTCAHLAHHDRLRRNRR